MESTGTYPNIDEDADVASARATERPWPPPNSARTGIYSTRYPHDMPSAPPLVEGDVVAQKYYVDRIVGNDGLAVVAHVRHVELGRRYMFKYVPPECCGYPEVVARFLRGARKAQSLQSEHAARMVDAGRLESGAPFAVSEFVSGGALSEVLVVRGALPVTDCVDYTLQAAEALAEGHQKGLVHKNLNLSRIFLTQKPDGSPFVKVSDFGVADALHTALPGAEYAFESRTPYAAFVDESLSCLAPEQVRNNKQIDAHADIWALGVILHQLLTGSPVYQAETLAALFAMIAADPPTPVRALRSDVPVGLERVILRCLEKDPAARFPTLGEFALALKPFALPEARACADRVMRTIGRHAHMPRNPAAMVHVGPPVEERASRPPSPAEMPRVPPPPPRQAEPPANKFGVVLLGAGGAVAGALLTLALVRVSSPEPAAPASAANDQQLTVQRELIREIAALRAAREDSAKASEASDSADAKAREKKRVRTVTARISAKNGAEAKASRPTADKSDGKSEELESVNGDGESKTSLVTRPEKKATGDNLFDQIH